MKHARVIVLFAAILLLVPLFSACTGDIPPPYTGDDILADVTVHTKVVAYGMKEDGSDDVLLDEDIEVTSTTKKNVSIKDLAKTIKEDGYLNTEILGSQIKAFGGYEADDTHFWNWALNGESVAIGKAITEGDTVVFSYGTQSGGDASGENAIPDVTVTLTIEGPDGTVFSGDVTVKEQKSVSVKSVLQVLKEDKTLAITMPGSISAINGIEKTDSMIWKIYVNTQSAKLTTKVENGNMIRIAYEAI